MSHATADHTPPTRHVSTLEVLQRVFGIGFDVWCHGQQWTRLTQVDNSLPTETVVDVLRDASTDEPCCTQLCGDDSLLVIPFLDEGEPRAAVACFRGWPPNALLRLANSALLESRLRDDLAALRVENHSLVMQVTDDFEELAFLRAVAGELELTADNRGLMHIGGRVLPLLRDSMGVESLVLVESHRDEDADHCHPQRVLVRTGRDLLGEQECLDLILFASAGETLQPVVRNRFHESEDAGCFPEVREFMLVPVAKNDRLHGWLLAINRKRDSAADCDFYWQETRLEFGTAEASVVRTAATMLASHAQNVELFRQKERLLTDMVRALVNAIEAKDEYTRGHSERVALFAKRLGEELGLERDAGERLFLTGLLHDVGKIGVDDATLQKPGRLNEDELAHIKKHPDSGWAILQGLEHLRYVLPGVLHHHEKFDGTGYPDRLAGDAIPLDGRILAVCDAYDAMTSDRPYRQGMAQEKAEAILRDGAGSEWDPAVVEAFFDAMPDILEIRAGFRPRPHQVRPPSC